MPDQRNLRERLLDVVDEIEAIVMEIIDRIVVGKRPDAPTQETISSLVEEFNEKCQEYELVVNTVPGHQERAEEMRKLQKRVDVRDEFFVKIAAELKFAYDTMAEAIFQANKKLNSICMSETNRVFSNEVVRYAHLISKDFSLMSPNDWHPGDPRRPYPTEAMIANSRLMRSHLSNTALSSSAGSSQHANAASSSGANSSQLAGSSYSILRQPQQTSATGADSSPAGGSCGASLSRTVSSGALRSSPMTSTSGALPFQSGAQLQKASFTPSPRSNIFGTGASTTSGSTSAIGGSPRSRLPGAISSAGSSTGRLPSPSARSINPSILQRRPSQSPRISGSNPITVGIDEKPQQQLSPASTMAGGSFMPASSMAGGVNTISNIASTFAHSGGESSGGEMLDASAAVEQMTSDSSSSSSSDEASRDQ